MKSKVNRYDFNTLVGVHLFPLVSSWCPVVSSWCPVVSTWFRRGFDSGFDVTSKPHVALTCGLENIHCLNPNLTSESNFDLISRSKYLIINKVNGNCC